MTLVEPSTGELLEEWQLTLDGELRHGTAARVVDVRTSAGRPALLKLGTSEHEALALQHWQGNGAVGLLRADPHRRAVLLERLHRETAGELWDVEACELVAGLYQRLHVVAPPQLRRLSSLLGGWARRLEELPRSAPVPRRLVQQSLAVARRFASDEQTDGRLLHGVLHLDHVLAADREPWLVISPAPLSGDPHFEPAPALSSRWDEVVASGDVRGVVRRRFHTIVDTAGLDETRARDWAVLRMVLAAVEELGRDEPNPAAVTRSITIAKAVQE